MNFLPDNIASFGAHFDSLTALITVMAVIALIGAEGALLYAAFKYRRKNNPKASHFTGSGWAQAKWVALPVIVVAVMDFTIDAQTHDVWVEMEETIPEDARPTRIVAQQFAWVFVSSGPDGILDTGDDVTVGNELHVPVDTDIAFELQARDVLHSFWVPSLRLKLDAIPGRTMRGWFRAIETGEYDIGCAELCGLGHGIMKGTLHVHSAADYRVWLAQAGD